MGEARLGLKLLFWGAGARTAGALVQRAWWYQSERGGFRFDRAPIESLRDALHLGIPIFMQLAGLAATVLMAVGAWRVARSVSGRARGFFWAAMVGIACNVIVHIPSLLLNLRLWDPKLIPDLLWRILGPMGSLGLLALLAGMRELAIERKLRIPYAAGIALATMWIWDALYWQLLIRWLAFHWDDVWRFVILGCEVADTILLLILLDGLDGALEPPKAISATEWDKDTGWQLAADGLRAYTSALLGRIYMLLGAVFFLIFAIVGRIPQFALLVVIAVPILTVLFSIWMLIGIKRFADFVPQETEARPAAGVAVKLMIAAALLDGVALAMLLMMFIDHHASEHAQETVSMASNGALLLGMIGMFILLGVFRRVGRFIGNAEVVRRARTSTILIALSAVILTELRTLGPDADRVLRHSEGGQLAVLFLLAVALLVLAIWGLVVYVGLLRRLRDAMLGGTEAAAAPAAQPPSPISALS